MSQGQMTEACVQYEAARELAEMVRPLIGRLIRSAHSLRQAKDTPEAIHPETPVQAPTGRPLGDMEAQQS